MLRVWTCRCVWTQRGAAGFLNLAYTALLQARDRAVFDGTSRRVTPWRMCANAKWKKRKSPRRKSANVPAHRTMRHPVRTVHKVSPRAFNDSSAMLRWALTAVPICSHDNIATPTFTAKQMVQAAVSAFRVRSRHQAQIRSTAAVRVSQLRNRLARADSHDLDSIVDAWPRPDFLADCSAISVFCSRTCPRRCESDGSRGFADDRPCHHRPERQQSTYRVDHRATLARAPCP